jgi:hypothetical protein
VQLNLTRHTSEVVQTITASKMNVKDQDTIIEICVILHQRYEEFADKMIESLEKVFDAERGLGEFTKKRNIMRLLSELYLKGLFNDYRMVFRCLNYMMMIQPTPQTMEDFKNGLMVLTDYLKTYGEIFFNILSRQRREAIEMDHEVTIHRYDFLNQNQRDKIYQYFKKHLNEKCIGELNQKFRELKQLQARHEDNIKEVKEDERIEREYAAAT